MFNRGRIPHHLQGISLLCPHSFRPSIRPSSKSSSLFDVRWLRNRGNTLSTSGNLGKAPLKCAFRRSERAGDGRLAAMPVERIHVSSFSNSTHLFGCHAIHRPTVVVAPRAVKYNAKVAWADKRSNGRESGQAGMRGRTVTRATPYDIAEIRYTRNKCYCITLVVVVVVVDVLISGLRWSLGLTHQRRRRLREGQTIDSIQC